MLNMLPQGRCKNPRCNDTLFVKSRLCPSCRWAARRGLMWGGVIGGIVVAVLKWWVSR